MIEYGGRPADWVAKHGRPARCLDSKWSPGLPAYESENRKLFLYENQVIVFGPNGAALMTPLWYGPVSFFSPGGLVKATFNGQHLWRPIVYTRGIRGRWQAMGSQRELSYRYSMYWVYLERNAGELQEADAKAEQLLLSMLTPLQRLEYAATDKFRVRGGATGNLYQINVGDGFSLMSKDKDEEIATFCLHPEDWTPEGDVALTQKLSLEDPELEEQVLMNANTTWCGPETGHKATRGDLYARDIEFELITA